MYLHTCRYVYVNMCFASIRNACHLQRVLLLIPFAGKRTDSSNNTAEGKQQDSCCCGLFPADSSRKAADMLRSCFITVTRSNSKPAAAGAITAGAAGVLGPGAAAGSNSQGVPAKEPAVGTAGRSGQAASSAAAGRAQGASAVLSISDFKAKFSAFIKRVDCLLYTGFVGRHVHLGYLMEDDNGVLYASRFSAANVALYAFVALSVVVFVGCAVLARVKEPYYATGPGMCLGRCHNRVRAWLLDCIVALPTAEVCSSNSSHCDKAASSAVTCVLACGACMKRTSVRILQCSLALISQLATLAMEAAAAAGMAAAIAQFQLCIT
jgi:hypothetical protein